ncbi:DNA endonuclease [Litchfieldia alkalitelluris]|uniref:DNA endonuclease n=1 Tax=Litchfieldia alkalitelluris TaxID=304268 RepID=UPI00195E4C61|nr:DNA endonuclease [Litchfieldia alkalitelluris]
MQYFEKLTDLQQNVLVASIIEDGEITNLYSGSRRKNNSYREHYGKKQEQYRVWKMEFLPEIFYLTEKSSTLRSKSLPLFTELYPHFYNEKGLKKIPVQLSNYITSPIFLAIVYMDDGTLSISKQVNHLKQLLYVTPTINLYLQNYPQHELHQLKAHIEKQFNISFSLNKRKDSFDFILRLTSTKNTYLFLDLIKEFTKDCPSMYYKTNWEWRLAEEIRKLKNHYPDYEVLDSNPNRFKNYSLNEINQLISLKRSGITDKQIAIKLQRSYWSIDYKLKEIRKDGLL